MKFEIGNQWENGNNSLVYLKSEHSFEIENYHETGSTSILINDLHLEIDEEGTVISLWGFCPLVLYQDTLESPQNYKKNQLKIVLNEKLVPGISYRFNEKRWPIHFNQKDGWICIGDISFDEKNLVEFVSNCIGVINKQKKLTAIWLAPRFL